MQEEAAREQKAREEQAANEEFEKWKSHIVVDTEGTLEDTEKQTQGLLVDFVEYIKVVILTIGSRLSAHRYGRPWSLLGFVLVYELD